MHRIDSSGAVASIPAVAPAGSIAGYWSNGNPVGGVPATQLDQDWFNAVQEELLAVVVAAGLTPSKSIRNQLQTALRILFGGGGSLGAAGFMPLPDGLILQWAGGSSITGAGDAVTFPYAFPTACRAVVVNEANASGWVSGSQPTIYGANAASKTSFSLYASKWNGSAWAAAPTVAYSYIAVGH